MDSSKVLLAGCATPIISADIQTQLESIGFRVNVIGELKNLMVSVALDRPKVVCIHFHEFTHNALELSKELYEKYNICTVFIVSSSSFKDAVEMTKGSNVLACLSIPFSLNELNEALELI